MDKKAGNEAVFVHRKLPLDTVNYTTFISKSKSKSAHASTNSETLNDDNDSMSCRHH